MILVLGGGESGVGAAKLAQKNGFQVFVSDNGLIKDDYKKILDENNIAWEEGKHSSRIIEKAELVIKSPGIPDKIALIKEFIEKGIPVISEIEFAYRYSKGKIIAITGSNGKTTTTSLVYHILNKAGYDVAVGGNIGKSFASILCEREYEYYVLELSSFQLDGIKTFKPDVAILLNISPDHLDRYEYKLEKYVASKFRIAMNQDENDVFIYCDDDFESKKYMTNNTLKAKKVPFSIEKSIQGEGAHLENEKLIINYYNDPFTMYINELALQGKHNAYNSMAASISARVVQIRKEVIRESLSDFKNIEHRLEYVVKVNGIEFINDSKATNVNSTWYALESIHTPIIWIAGGVDKGNDYSILKELVSQKVKALICLGLDNQKLIDEFSGIVPIIEIAGSAPEAVYKAYRLGKKDDTVLLSPCCASFDLFDNYEDRGRKFKNAVRAL
jgi:UDP-N-acetylmuramoylalanine--D-glutamate ligase